ncbi:GGDEF domain-containing response regulator [Paraliobacillus salinarum]|uniref:GGDEF domain-containing response regulator n=1 Tax=Paraliobacillus salinarum TaxID=1158996 RepID=UPI0015F4AC2E|nr:diguanylate cyclase [Paraliobacillus salinarum]
MRIWSERLMDTYKQMYIERHKKIIDTLDQQKTISRDDLYEILTNISKTASYVGLDKFSQVSSSLLERLNMTDKIDWTNAEWSNFIQPLMELFYEETKKLENRKRILLIDKNENSLNQTKEALEDKKYEVLLATNRNRAVQFFYDFHPDVLILHLCNDEQMVFDIIHRLKKRANESGMIMMVVGKQGDAHLKMKAYDADVTDYIEKPIQYDVLEHILQNRIRQQHFFRESILIDELTQAYNRTFLNTIWKGLMKKYKQSDRVFCIAILDLDFFKRTNDQYGHGVGDDVLKYFSAFILRNKQNKDYFIRYGGEEFILIINELDQAAAAEYMQQLLDGLLKTPFNLDGKDLPISFTAGVSQMDIQIEQIETLIEQADRALNYGKKHGRKRIVKYNGLVDQEQLSDQREILKLAIVDDDRFVRHMLKDKLTKLEINPYQIEVESFSDGEGFISSDWYKGRDKKILLLDGVLPKMDGLDILQKLREIVNEEELGIIMLTGRQKNSDMVQALELGADDYITKPFNVKQLEARIKRLVQRLFKK